MAFSALNVLSGIAAAAAGLTGEKVSKTGSIPGFDIAAILPALLGSKAGGAAGLVGTLASAAAPALLGGKAGGAAGLVGTLASAATKSGVLNASNLGNLASLAGTLISATSKAKAPAKSTGSDGIMGLASAIFGNSGSGADLGSIATLAAKLGKTTDGGATGVASDLGSTLKNSFGVHFDGAGTVINALTKVMGGDGKADLIKAVLKGIS
jgi:hypothetical protein